MQIDAISLGDQPDKHGTLTPTYSITLTVQGTGTQYDGQTFAVATLTRYRKPQPDNDTDELTAVLSLPHSILLATAVILYPNQPNYETALKSYITYWVNNHLGSMLIQQSQHIPMRWQHTTTRLGERTAGNIVYEPVRE